MKTPFEMQEALTQRRWQIGEEETSVRVQDKMQVVTGKFEEDKKPSVICSQIRLNARVCCLGSQEVCSKLKVTRIQISLNPG